MFSKDQYDNILTFIGKQVRIYQDVQAAAKDCGLAEKSSKYSHKDIMGSSPNEGDGLGDELDSIVLGGKLRICLKLLP